MRFQLPENGHDMEVMEIYEMGGGVEELTLWCHTCDPTGERCVNYDMRHFPKWRLAMAEARQDAYRHSHNINDPLKNLTTDS